MPSIMIGKVAHDIEDAGTAKAVVDAMDENQAKLDAMQAKLDTANGTAAGFKAKVDEFELNKEKEKDDMDDEEKKKKEDEINEEVEARIDTAEKVRAIAPDAKIDGLNVHDMKVAALTANGVKLDSETPEYVNAYFNIMTSTKADSMVAMFNKETTPKVDAENDPRAKFMKKQGA